MNAKPVIASILCGLIGLFPQIAPAHLFQGSVSVLVDDKIDNTRNGEYEVTQNLVLGITLLGKAKNPETRVVKWTAYGRDCRTDAISVLSSGEVPVDFTNGLQQKIRSEEISTTSTPTHNVMTTPRSSGGGRNRASSSQTTVQTKVVEGTGVRYLGYGVQVFEGDKVVGEKFDPSRLEADIKSKGVQSKDAADAAKGKNAAAGAKGKAKAGAIKKLGQ